MKPTTLITTIAATTFLAVSAFAQTNPLAKNLAEDNRVPDSPAAAVLGVAPTSVLHPTAPPELHAALLKATDANGNIQNGIAFDLNPFMLYAGDSTTLSDYANFSIAERLIANTKVSFATTKGESTDDKSARVALGLHTSWIFNDPRTDKSYLKCLGDVGGRVLDAAGPPPSPFTDDNPKFVAWRSGIEDSLKTPPNAPPRKPDQPARTHAECREDHSIASRGGIAAGIAPTWESKDGDADSLNGTGLSGWASLSTGLPTFGGKWLDPGTAILTFLYQGNQNAPHPTASNTFIEQDLLVTSAALKLNGSSKWTSVKDVVMTAEAGYVQADRQGLGQDDYWQYIGQVQFMVPSISDSIIFDLSLGQTSDRIKDESFGKLSLRWKFNEKKFQ